MYDTLTANRTRRVRLPELVFAAAERYPGLTPTRERLATDLARVQVERDGLEIDQGIFCGAILRSPTAGRHLIDTMLRPTERALELADRFAATGLVFWCWLRRCFASCSRVMPRAAGPIGLIKAAIGAPVSHGPQSRVRTLVYG